MEQILKPIGESTSSIFESDIVQFGLRAIGFYLVILWLATAYWAFRDMQQRSDNAILPYLAAAVIILFTPIFFILAFWIYKIVGPTRRSARSGSGIWPKRPSWPRSSRSTIARAVTGGSTTNGSSAPTAGPA